MKDRLARALHRIACKLSPLPPLVLLAEGWHYADLIRGHLAGTGVHLTVGLLSPVRSPPLSGQPLAAERDALVERFTPKTRAKGAPKAKPQLAGKNRKRRA